MKKTTIIIATLTMVFALATTIAKAQWSYPNATSIFTQDSVGIGTNNPLTKFHVAGNSYFNGNVGVGTSSPASKFHVVGNGIISGNLGIGTTTPSSKLHVVGESYFNGNVGIGTTTPSVKLHVIGNGTFSGNVNMANLNLVADAIIAGAGRLHITGEEYLYLLNKNGVVISKSWNGNGNLTVEGAILTSKIKVAVNPGGDWNFAMNKRTNDGWADYVFDENYILMPLTDVEQYIKLNNHLPNVPSAAEMVKEGNDLGKTDAKLLEKIEELTLYMIEMKKQADLQQKEIEILKKKLQKRNK